MYAMADHKDKAGLLSEIVQKADQNSVTLALGGDVSKLTQKPYNVICKTTTHGFTSFTAT